MTSTIITIIVCTAVMGMAIWYYRKACEAYDKATDRCDSARSCATLTHQKIMDIEGTLPHGYTIQVFPDKVDVRAYYQTFSVIVRSFPKDDDSAYALREAEYLLQTLKEK